jgi:hypothetical protein
MGDAYGKDVFKAGSDDYRTRQQMEEWKAERHAPVVGAGGSSQGSGPTYYSSGGYSGRGLSFGKVLLYGVIAVALIGYFGSKSDQRSPSRQDEYWAQHEAAQSRFEATRSKPATQSSPPYAAPREATAPPPTVATSSTTKLDANDQRVVAAIDDVRAVAQLTLFTSNGGELLVFEGQLDTPQRNLTQTKFNVGDLDLDRATYHVDTSNLNIPCKQNAVCVAYNVYQGSTAQTAGASQQYGTYTSMNVWSSSNEAANRMLQDFQQLQNLQQ